MQRNLEPGEYYAWENDDYSEKRKVIVQDVGKNGSGNFLYEYIPFLDFRLVDKDSGEVQVKRAPLDDLCPKMMLWFSVLGRVLPSIYFSLPDNKELKDLFFDAVFEVNELFFKVSSAAKNNHQLDTSDQSTHILRRLHTLKRGVETPLLHLQGLKKHSLIARIETAIVEANAMVQEACLNPMRDENDNLEFSEENEKLFSMEFFTALQRIDRALLTKNFAIAWAPDFPDTKEAKQSLPYVTELRSAFFAVICAAQGCKISFPIHQAAAQDEEKDGEQQSQVQQQETVEQRQQFILKKLTEFEYLYKKHKSIFHKNPWYIELGKWIAIAIGLAAAAVLTAGSLGGVAVAAAAVLAAKVTGMTSVVVLVAGSLSKYGFFAKDEIGDQIKIVKYHAWPRQSSFFMSKNWQGASLK